ncbi:IPT/TIG domain-containing protein [Actinoplanes sp. LDG1-06]|uniref:IPT/TIG domain-containing protein n=1 Tax=Paractinoplanes ovalisporus TaxID=2810368 RepID=A0ABS2ACD9_9ACTN|nr:IPT/TIG domain-containing protein [Actinoplanes ovalisporus]MBM2617018.1 IPT/TIG domain-containing protein [Actinoplanes ovalisporus]
MHRRVYSLIVASALGLASAGAGAVPAFAAEGGPAGLTTAGQACATTSPGPYLSPERLNDARAVVLDGTYDTSVWGAEPTADFQVWDTAHPDQPQDWSERAGALDGKLHLQLEDPERQLDGVTYAWKVRVDASPWSDTCYFTVDRSGGSAPAVTSDDYPSGDDPHGEVGTAGSFTFTAAADDTVSYQYSFWDGVDSGSTTGNQTVPASGLGGPATISWKPRTSGQTSLSVYAIDRAGNYSDRQYYAFSVRETRPSVFSAAYQNYESSADLDYNVGVPGRFEFSSNVADTSSFTWRIDEDGPSGTADADADGRADVMIAPAKPGHQTLHVRAITRDGVPHPEQAYEFYVDNGPRVTGDVNRGVIIGSSLRFHLAPRTSDVTSYVWWNSTGSSSEPDKKTIPVGADGTADLTWTADNTNDDTIGIRVQARSADGTLSQSRWLSMSVFGAAPWITRTGGDVVGSTATIKASTEMANPTEYEAVLNRDATTKQVVPAAADGTATFRFPVTKAQYTSVSVIARNAAGVHTHEGGTSWSVSNGPVVTSADFGSSGHIRPGTFTFKSQQAGATKFIYSISGTDLYNVEVPVGSDGTAVVPWTPTTSGYFSLYASSKTADGVRSTETYYSFYIEADPVTVTAVSPATVMTGGVRTITITGSGFNTGNYVNLYLSDGGYESATITGVSADRTTLTATVDLTGAATGPVTVGVQPDGFNGSVRLDNAFTIVAAPALKPVTKPAITGQAAVGSQLKASTGTWNPKGTAFTYRWAAGGTPIDGATGATYRVQAADLGKRLSVEVTATRSGYTAATARSTATAAVAKGPAPVATVLPKITGKPAAGSAVQATTGTWKPAADAYSYEWRANGKLLSTTSASLDLTAAMAGQRLTVTVVAARAGHTTGRATSTPVTIQK